MTHAGFLREGHGARFEQSGESAEWLTAHEELTRLARRRAESDWEEGRGLLAAFRASVHRFLGFGSFAEYVESLFGYKPRSVEEKLRVADALEQLPLLSEELRKGCLSWSVVRELTRVATSETEGAWHALARGKTVRQLEAWVSGRKPGDWPDSPADPSLRIHRLVFEVHAETYATFREAVGRLRRDASEPLDEETALLLMARQVLGGPVDEGRANYQIALTVCEHCQRGFQSGRGLELEVDSSVVDMATCDAQVVGRVEPLLRDDDSMAESHLQVCGQGRAVPVSRARASHPSEQNVCAHVGGSWEDAPGRYGHSVIEKEKRAFVGGDALQEAPGPSIAGLDAEKPAAEASRQASKTEEPATGAPGKAEEPAPGRVEDAGLSPVTGKADGTHAVFAEASREPNLARVGREPNLAQVGREPNLAQVGREPNLAQVGRQPKETGIAHSAFGAPARQRATLSARRRARATQKVPPSIRRLVLCRDGKRCVVPGCYHSVFLDLHHLELRSEGGGHEPTSLITLCGAHHRAAHRGSLVIEGRTASTVVFRHADGSQYRTEASSSLANAQLQAFAALRRLGFREGEVKNALARLRAEIRPERATAECATAECATAECATAESIVRAALRILTAGACVAPESGS